MRVFVCVLRYPVWRGSRVADPLRKEQHQACLLYTSGQIISSYRMPMDLLLCCVSTITSSGRRYTRKCCGGSAVCRYRKTSSGLRNPRWRSFTRSTGQQCTCLLYTSFVKLDMIWDEKWLNATVTLPKIEEQMKSRMYQIGTDVVTISKLPEFKFEAMEVYRCV